MLTICRGYFKFDQLNLLAENSLSLSNFWCFCVLLFLHGRSKKKLVQLKKSRKRSKIKGLQRSDLLGCSYKVVPSLVPSFHLFDLLIGIAGAVIIRLLNIFLVTHTTNWKKGNGLLNLLSTEQLHRSVIVSYNY